MEPPQAGSTIYLDGLPLARIEPLSDEDRLVVEETVKIHKRRQIIGVVCIVVIWFGYIAACVAAGVFRKELDFFVAIPVLTAPLILVTRSSVDRKAIRGAKEKWVFEGSRAPFPLPLGLLSFERPLLRRWHKGPVWVLQPRNVLIEPVKGMRPAESARFCVLDTDSSRANSLSHGGTKEVRAAFSRLAAQGVLSATIASLSLLGLVLLLQRGFPEAFWQQLLLALSVVGLIDAARTLLIVGRRGVPLLRGLQQSGLIRISVLSPAYQATAHSCLDVEGALRYIEVCETGLVWTVDGRPAAWRIYGVEPVFINAAALKLPVLNPAKPQDSALPEGPTTPAFRHEP